jgi:hypothetical protein
MHGPPKPVGKRGNEKTGLTVWVLNSAYAAALVGQQNQFVNMRKVLGVQSVEV